MGSPGEGSDCRVVSSTPTSPATPFCRGLPRFLCLMPISQSLLGTPLCQGRTRESQAWTLLPKALPASADSRSRRRLNAAPSPAGAGQVCQCRHPAAHPRSLPALCQHAPEVEGEKPGVRYDAWSTCSAGAGPLPGRAGQGHGLPQKSSEGQRALKLPVSRRGWRCVGKPKTCHLHIASAFPFMNLRGVWVQRTDNTDF